MKDCGRPGTPEGLPQLGPIPLAPVCFCQQSAGMDLTFPFPQHINELTMKLSVEDVLTRAEALYRQLTACPVSL